PPWSVPRERQSCDEFKPSSTRPLRTMSRQPARVDSGKAIRYRRCVMQRPAGALVVAMLLLGLQAWGDELPGTVVNPPPAPPSPNRFSVLPGQWQKDVPPSEALEVPRPVTRDAETQTVTLQEAIALALENNPGIAAQRLEPVRVDQDVLQAQSEYDPALGGNIVYDRSTTPNANVLAGTRTTELDNRNYDLNLGKLFRPGTRLTLDYNWDRLSNNGRFFQLRPEYTPQLGFSIAQPL